MSKAGLSLYYGKDFHPGETRGLLNHDNGFIPEFWGPKRDTCADFSFRITGLSPPVWHSSAPLSFFFYFCSRFLNVLD
jgi:hypothetical protein